MPFVIDASVVGSWAFPDEEHTTAELALERMRVDEAVAPILLWFEIRNILVVNERKRRISSSGADAFLKQFSTLSVRLDSNPDERVVFDLARRHKLSVYDASYLSLAMKERAALATLDENLAKAAGREGVVLVAQCVGYA